MTTTNARQDCLALPYLASTEAKAWEFADALECVYINDIKVDVFDCGNKWGVVVIEGAQHIGDIVYDWRIASLVILLSQYDLTESTGDIETVGNSVYDIPPIQRQLTRRARRQFRIEDKLDAILGRLEAQQEAHP